jgi:microcystin-dependent protein
MADQYLGEIRMVCFNYAPLGWALCDGQIIAIQTNTALFSLLGTTYGGNGTTNFALPNLQGRVAIHQGNGAGLSPYIMGQQGGTESVTLTSQQMPQHNHLVSTVSAQGSQPRPGNNLLATGSGGNNYAPGPSDGSTLNPAAVSLAGGNQPHPNIQPYLCINFIIALQGIYPPRS